MTKIEIVPILLLLILIRLRKF